MIYDRVHLHEIALPEVGASAPDHLTPPMRPFPVMSDDLLVHEAIDLKALQKGQDYSPAQIKHLQDSHADVTKVGAVA